MKLVYINAPKPRGFTIIELLVVVVIIGILATISLVTYSGIQDNAAKVVLQSDLKQASTQLELYRLNSGAYPESEDELPRSTNTEYEYTRTDNSYCLTAWSDAARTSYFVASTDGRVTEGKCDDHLGYTDNPQPPTITTDSLPDAAHMTAYSATVQVMGHGSISFSISAGSLPDGLSIDSATGVISGTPTDWGTSSFTVVATSAIGQAERSLSITVTPPAPQILTTSLPDGSVGAPGGGTPYSATVQASPSSGVTFSVSSGSLPPGLSLDSETGVISGTPTEASTSCHHGTPFTFTITASNSGGSHSMPLSIEVLPFVCR